MSGRAPRRATDDATATGFSGGRFALPAHLGSAASGMRRLKVSTTASPIRRMGTSGEDGWWREPRTPGDVMKFSTDILRLRQSPSVVRLASLD